MRGAKGCRLTGRRQRWVKEDTLIVRVLLLQLLLLVRGPLKEAWREFPRLLEWLVFLGNSQQLWGADGIIAIAAAGVRGAEVRRGGRLCTRNEWQKLLNGMGREWEVVEKATAALGGNRAAAARWEGSWRGVGGRQPLPLFPLLQKEETHGVLVLTLALVLVIDVGELLVVGAAPAAREFAAAVDFRGGEERSLGRRLGLQERRGG